MVFWLTREEEESDGDSRALPELGKNEWFSGIQWTLVKEMARDWVVFIAEERRWH